MNHNHEPSNDNEAVLNQAVHDSPAKKLIKLSRLNHFLFFYKHTQNSAKSEQILWL